MAATFTGIRVSGVIRLTEVPTPAPTDLYPQYTVLRLPGTGTNNTANNTFLDSSSNNFAITRAGNTTQGSFSPFSTAPGYWSNYFDGSGDYLSIPTQTISSSQSFCLEAWVFVGASAGGELQTIFGGPDDNFGDQRNVQFRIGSSNIPYIYFGGGSASASVAVSVNTWTHVAAVRNGNSLRIYVNGVGGTSSTTSVSGQIRHIGALGRGSGVAKLFTGYISNARITVGSPVYTANFTPSTTPLTAVSGTSLLTCQSNRFIDNSANNVTITRSGDTAVSAFGPYAPASSYDSATMGGSIYFDGSGDFITLNGQSAFAFGTDDFTVETWYYAAGTAQAVLFDCRASGGGNSPNFALYNNPTNNTIRVYVNGTDVLIGSTSIATNRWYHVAVSRQGTTMRLFINGVLDATATNSTNLANGANRPIIGADGSLTSSGNLNGYLSNLRVVKGTAVYTSNFTPPTLPVSAISGTQLLLNGTNGAIYDASTKNVLETAGDARVSTTVSANGSMYFDGTGDYLTAPASNLFNFRTGDFTIEAWIYLNSVGGQIIDTRSSDVSGAYAFAVSGTGKLDFLFQSSAPTRVTSSGNVTTSQWVHVAVSRSGSTIRLFINGVQDGSVTFSGAINSLSFPSIGGGRASGSNVINGYYLNGYINDLRITNGIARYTTNFTPPTRS